MRAVAITVLYLGAVLTAVMVARFAIVGTVIWREIAAADARCGAGIDSGRVKDKADVEQEYAMVAHAVDDMLLLALDLRKWTHRQFFPHGSAR